MGGLACSASSTTFVVNIGGPFGLPIKQLLLLLLDPVGVVARLLHEHARLIAGVIIMAVVGEPDVLGTGASFLMPSFLNFHGSVPDPPAFSQTQGFFGILALRGSLPQVFVCPL